MFFRRTKRTQPTDSKVTSSRKRSQRRAASRRQTWSIESLEERTLLSGVPFLPAPPLFVSPAAYVVHATPAVATHIGVSLPTDVLNGVPVNVQLTELDANNHVVRSANDTVTLTTSDGGATLSASSVTFVNGVANVKVTFVTPGTQSLFITDTTNATLSTTASTNVGLTDVATHFSIYIPQNTPNGKPVNVALVALDAQNHVVQSFADTVTLSLSDSAGTLSANSVTFKNGFATVKATFVTAGPQTITATDTSNALLVGIGTTNVAGTLPVSTPVVATHFTYFLSQNVQNGQTVTVGVVALDAQNHLVQNFADTVNLKVSDPTTTLSASSVTFVNGFASFKATFVNAGTQTITATDSVTPTLTSTATTNVAAVDVATHLSLALPQYVNAGQAVYVKLVALDAQNHIVQNYAGNLSLASSDTGATLPSTITFHNGVAWVRVVFSTTGQQTLTVIDNSNVLAAVSATTSVSTHSRSFRGWFSDWFGGRH